MVGRKHWMIPCHGNFSGGWPASLTVLGPLTDMRPLGPCVWRSPGWAARPWDSPQDEGDVLFGGVRPALVSLFSSCEFLCVRVQLCVPGTPVASGWWCYFVSLSVPRKTRPPPLFLSAHWGCFKGGSSLVAVVISLLLPACLFVCLSVCVLRIFLWCTPISHPSGSSPTWNTCSFSPGTCWLCRRTSLALVHPSAHAPCLPTHTRPLAPISSAFLPDTKPAGMLECPPWALGIQSQSPG